MLKSFVVSFLLIFPVLSFAQVGSQKQGGAGNQYGYRIKPTKDNGFIIGGFTDSKGAGNYDYWVMRFDNFGKPLWDSAYGNPVYDNLWSIEPTKDNGALLAGYSTSDISGTAEALMYKIDSVGRVIKKLEVDYAAADHAHWFKQLDDGNYYWTGHTDSKGDPSGDMIMQKLDSNFNLVWEKTYDNGSSEHCHAAAVTPDNGCILIGHTTINNHEKYFAVRVDTSGKALWKKTYGSDPVYHDSPYDVVVTREGNYAFFGSSGDYSTVGSMWLLVVDPSGKVILDKHNNIDFSFGWSGIQSSDSGFVEIGYSAKPGSANSHLYVVKTDKRGNLQWQRSLGDSTGGYSVFQRGSQYVLCGVSDQTTDHLDDLWIVVLDSAGNPALLDTATTKDTLKTAAITGLKLNGDSHLKLIANDMPLIISWAQTGDIGTSVDVTVSLDGGAHWNKIQTVPSNVNSTSWSNTPKTGYYPACLVRVTSATKLNLFVQSDSFAIGSTAGVTSSFSNNDYNVANYPNPFATSTFISFTLAKAENVKLEIFNTIGEKITTLMDRKEEVGSHFIRYMPKDLSNGTYFYRLTTATGTVIKEMVVKK